MTPEERAAKCLELAPVKRDNDSMFLPCDLVERIAAAIRQAEADMKKQCIRYIHRQNALVNDLLGGNRHDAFVADITAGIGNLD
jgi:hypothetical protein